MLFRSLRKTFNKRLNTCKRGSGMQNNFKSALNATLHSLGVLFSSQQWKEIIIFLFFLLLSFGFWLLQSLQQEYEHRVDLPIRYKNVPSEWILSGNNPQKISIQLKDKGTVLIYYSWKSNSDPIDISLTGLVRMSDYSLRVPSDILEAAISKMLISSTSIIAVNPREIEIRYDSLSNSIVPVEVESGITTKPGFQISDKIRISPSEVQLFGRRGVAF